MADRLRARLEQDARGLLDAVRVPTLVIHRRDDAVIRVAAGRHLAERIAGAKYVELPGADHYFFTGDSDAIVDEIEEFLTGARTGAEGDVTVSTIVFTDIVDSTRQEADTGHQAWSKLTAEHDAMVRASIRRYRGHEVKNLGDGFLATFDGASRRDCCAGESSPAPETLGWPFGRECIPEKSSSATTTSPASL